MVVTGSREAALKYFLGMQKYIKKMGYYDFKALVAFSGDLVVDGETYTEAQLNGFSETQLPEKFDGDGYRLLIVAEKYRPDSINRNSVACMSTASFPDYRRCRRYRG